MNVDLGRRHAVLCGLEEPILGALETALAASGCTVLQAAAPLQSSVPDLLILGHPLRPDGDLPVKPVDLDPVADAMAERGSGRIVLLLSAIAAVPARRFPQASVAAGAAMLTVRTLAMRLGPAVLVNAIGCGAMAGPDGQLFAGDASMLSHVPSGQPGTVEDIVHAVLFLCDPLNSYMTGQLLTLDGGWSTGYGRNF